jgi:ATP-dependent DNA helicase DinG
MRTSTELLTNPEHGLVREARPSQLAMAASIEQVLAEGGAYFVEAPVATGKTFAYLLPALLSAGRRVVVATAKKTLQDQILQKDFPALVRALGRDVPPMRALPLKGKSNYACRLSAAAILEKNPGDQGPYATFLTRSSYGDRAEYAGTLPRWWGAATAEDCIHRRCAHYNECGYASLKRELAQARLVVINHHVLGAEMFFGHGKLVGGPFDVLIIDEAHALAAGIRAAFTHRVAEDSISSLNDLLRRTSETFASVRRLLTPWEAMFEAVPNRNWADPTQREFPVFPEGLAGEVIEGLNGVQGELQKLAGLYNSEDDEPDEPPERDAFDEPIEAIEVEAQAQEIATEETRNAALAAIAQAQRRVDSLVRGLSTAQGLVAPDPVETDADKQEMRRARILANTAIYSTQDERGRFGINCAPVNVGGIAGKYLGEIKTVVVCSATLAVDGRFDHVTSMTGVAPVKAEVLPTSFNYDAQGFAFIPRGLPVVGRQHPDYADVMQRRVEMAVKLVEWSDGGAFVLTTANDELDAFATALKRRFPGRVFVQGHRKNPWDGDPHTALTKFRAVPDSILVGSKSFWEGVDVPGGALRLVIMAKLPFPQYGDPIIKARERIAGEDAFRDVQLVDMLVDLRQGLGRLIRTREDRGCAAVLDSRVWEKSYGGLVRRALPWSNSTVTSDLAVCERYLPRFAAHFQRKAAQQAASTFAQ